MLQLNKNILKGMDGLWPTTQLDVSPFMKTHPTCFRKQAWRTQIQITGISFTNRGFQCFYNYFWKILLEKGPKYTVLFDCFLLSCQQSTHLKQSQSLFSSLYHYSYIHSCQILAMSYLFSPLTKDHLLINIIANEYWPVSEKTVYGDGCSKTSKV